MQTGGRFAATADRQGVIPTMNKLKYILGLSLGLFSCVVPDSKGNPLKDQQQDMLIAVNDIQDVHLIPQVDSETLMPDYSLKYVYSENETSVETRYLGPGETLGTALYMQEYDMGEWSYLMCAPSEDFSVVLAKWRHDESGKATDIWVRVAPFIEWRALELKEFQLVSDVEWRPIVHGAGVGEWRR